MSPVKIMEMLNLAQNLLPSVVNFVDIFKKISSEVTIEDISKLRSEIDAIKVKEDIALENAKNKTIV
jgi:hypothetical protein